MNKKVFIVALVTVIIIIGSLLLFTLVVNRNKRFTPSSVTPSSAPHGKTIWLLWLQGWENAPRLAQSVRQAWINLNPDWRVECICERTLHNYIDVSLIHDGMGSAAKSDVIRLNLLSKFGGVWADASLLPFISLDSWIYDALQPVGFWMYHGRDYGNGPASWFIISTKQSYLIQKWSEKCNEYWKERRETDNYFWMDALFKDLLDNDSHFKHEWDCVPYLWCESRGQSHMLAGKVNNNNPELKEIIAQTPPYVLKLSFGGFSDDPNTNGNFALDVALSQRGAPYRLHKMIINKNHEKKWNYDKALIVSDCGNEEDVKELIDYSNNMKMDLVVYDKCKFCSHVPLEVYTRPLPNIGREQHTFLYFVITFYDNLPSHIYFLPTPIHKYARLNKVSYISELKEDDRSYCTSYKHQDNFELPMYFDTPLERAEVYPFRKWFETYIGPWDPEIPAICWTGVMRTNAASIRKKPKTFYQNLLDQSRFNHSEVGHFLERSMGAVF